MNENTRKLIEQKKPADIKSELNKIVLFAGDFLHIDTLFCISFFFRSQLANQAVGRRSFLEFMQWHDFYIKTASKSQVESLVIYLPYGCHTLYRNLNRKSDKIFAFGLWDFIVLLLIDKQCALLEFRFQWIVRAWNGQSNQDVGFYFIFFFSLSRQLNMWDIKDIVLVSWPPKKLTQNTCETWIIRAH